MSLETLPTELIQEIAILLGDHDLMNFRCVSKTVAFNTSSDSFNRVLFAQKFDTANVNCAEGGWAALYSKRVASLNIYPDIDFHNLGRNDIQTFLEGMEALVLGKSLFTHSPT